MDVHALDGLFHKGVGRIEPRGGEQLVRRLLVHGREESVLAGEVTVEQGS